MSTDDSKTGFVYALFDPANAMLPKYIGMTKVEVRQRLYTHMAWAFRFPKHPLAKWLREMDSRNQIPVVRILETGPLDQMASRETAWIRFYRPLGSLLNISDGPGMLGLKGTVSELNRQITRARNRLGMSDESREKIRIALSKPWSEERKLRWRNRPGYSAWRQKIAHHNKTSDRSKWNRPKTRPFSKHPEITLAKRAANPVIAAHIKRFAANEGRRRTIVCIETGQVFVSIKDATRMLGVHRVNILKAIRDNSMIGNRHFKFEERENISEHVKL